MRTVGWASRVDIAGYYKTYSLGTGFGNLDFHDYSFVGGPRFSYRVGRFDSGAAHKRGGSFDLFLDPVGTLETPRAREPRAPTGAFAQRAE